MTVNLNRPQRVTSITVPSGGIIKLKYIPVTRVMLKDVSRLAGTHPPEFSLGQVVCGEKAPPRFVFGATTATPATLLEELFSFIITDLSWGRQTTQARQVHVQVRRVVPSSRPQGQTGRILQISCTLVELTTSHRRGFTIFFISNSEIYHVGQILLIFLVFKRFCVSA